MKLKRIVPASLFIGSCLFFWMIASASAYTYPEVGDTITLSAGPGGGVNGGGEFYWDIKKKGVAPMDFISFCLEENEFIGWGGTYTVNSITEAAISGGVGGSVNGQDPLDARTAYLYTMFTNGTLAGFNYGNAAASAPALQLAIWNIENEIASVEAFGATSYSALAQIFLNEANNAISSGSWSGLGNVRVLNLLNSSGGPAQDQLSMAHTPEPATMLLFGAGLAGLAGLRLRRK